MDDIVSLTQLARQKKVDERLARLLATVGRIKATKVNSRYWVCAPDALDAWLASQSERNTHELKPATEIG